MLYMLCISLLLIICGKYLLPLFTFTLSICGKTNIISFINVSLFVLFHLKALWYYISQRSISFMCSILCNRNPISLFYIGKHCPIIITE